MEPFVPGVPKQERRERRQDKEDDEVVDPEPAPAFPEPVKQTSLCGRHAHAAEVSPAINAIGDA